MCFQVNPHGAGAFHGAYISKTLNLSLPSSCTTVKVTIAIAAVCPFQSRVEGRGIRPIANCGGSPHFAGLVIQYHHHLIANRKKIVVLYINSQSAGLFAGRYGPVLFYLKSGGIDNRYFALVLNVHKHFAIQISSCKLRLAIQRDSGDYFVFHRINNGRIPGSAIKSKNFFRKRIDKMASGFLPVTGILVMVANVFKSKTVTDESLPLLINPLPNSGASAMP